MGEDISICQVEFHISSRFSEIQKDLIYFYISGKISSYKHRIPFGDWFQYISCPHYFAECIIYLAFIIVASSAHMSMWALVIFVWVNQLVAARITHNWYKENFSNYPKDRYAVIPYIF